MDCREFRENHVAYVDDTMPGIEIVRMQMHVAECQSCARHDASIRRALMLFRSLPPIQPSPDFARRLQNRIHEISRTEPVLPDSARTRGLAATVVVSSMVMLGYIGVSLQRVDSPARLTLPPVVATAADPAPSALTSPSPEMVAAIPSGIPLWTAALVADQTTVHFASMDLITSGR